jgi:DUF438 domain-containing protein
MNAHDYAAGLSSDHPVRTYLEENAHIRKLLAELGENPPDRDFETFFNLFNQLCAIEVRYARKENQLFPFLEKRGWTGPSQGMWAFHDQIRALLKETRLKIETKNFKGASELLAVTLSEMHRMIHVEEQRLFPIALDILQPEDWETMAQGEAEIGWMHKSAPRASEAVPASEVQGTVPLEVGFLTGEQINLMLKFMPFDLTFVDEHDRVAFYNRGDTRVFPRSPGVIGRLVQFCHPPKSLATVMRILNEFKSGTKDEAEFWIDFKGRKIHIRYFAIRDTNKNYKGVIEVSQDVTDIQKLEGQCRLLNWERE